MKEYSIPIIWQTCRNYNVEANSLQEAVTKALRQFLSEPDDNYLDDTFEIDGIIEDEYPNEDYDMNKILNGL